MDSDYSIERVRKTVSINPNTEHVKITMTPLICHDLKDVDENKTTAGIHHIFLKFSFLEK